MQAGREDRGSCSGARGSLERSLERLQVDHVDLIQLHNLVEPDEWQVAHGTGGAVEALVQARDEGLVRFVGVTGHGTRIARMHLRSLERHARIWAGQSLRRLGWLSRAETTLVQARQRSEASGQAPRWQDVALDAGYADQSHLCRVTRRITGYAPQALYEGIYGHEAFWAYRIWV